jgi:hypothetical protein
MLNKFFLISATVLLTACAHLQTEPLKINALNDLPDVAIEFETTVIEADEKEQLHRWKFWRNKNRIETHNLSDNSGEIWTKSPTGKIEYERIFHDQKQIIDYRDSDLAAIGETPNWLAIATLLTPAEAQNPDSEITWLPESQIPAQIQRHENGHLITTKIVNLKTDAPLKTSDYRHIDFADIGDKESDPFIQSIFPKLKGGHHHEH